MLTRRQHEGLIEDHREVMAATEASDPVTQDILIGQLRGLELFLWFVRLPGEQRLGTEHG
ncbi:hypothetical protein GCM10010233_54830 [Streptomyces pseudogriseolus]|nr:hypothetical protein GCM10010233_54830 [Streptomyces gancidicus]